MAKLDLKDQFFIFILLNAIDAINTTTWVEAVGYSGEGNPVVRGLMEHFHSPLILWPWKLIILMTIGASIRYATGSDRESFFTKVMMVANVALLLTCCWGWYLLIGSL